jgi:hypothetical protein
MNRTLSNLGPALFFAAAILVASALVKAAPHTAWAAIASPALLVLALLGADLFQRRRLLPSPTGLLLATSFLVSCGLLASGGLAQFAPMIPILGSSIMLPVILRAEGKRPSCRRA